MNNISIEQSPTYRVSVSANEGGESMATETKYPEWKKAVIEGARTFATVFVSTVLVQLGAGVDFSQWRVWVVPMLLAGASAGFKALGKYIRDTYGQQDYSSLIYKITP